MRKETNLIRRTEKQMKPHDEVISYELARIGSLAEFRPAVAPKKLGESLDDRDDRKR